jgi:hypothetical protein
MILMMISPRSRCPSGRAAPSCARSWWHRWVDGRMQMVGDLVGVDSVGLLSYSLAAALM